MRTGPRERPRSFDPLLRRLLQRQQLKSDQPVTQRDADGFWARGLRLRLLGDPCVERGELLSVENPGLIAMLPNPNADLRRAMDEHQQALRAWKRRERAAARKCGISEALAACDTAADEVARVASDVAGVRARTVPGLQAKARMTDIEPDNDILYSIIDDLIAIS